MSAKDAVYANRYHHQWNPDVLMYEFMTNELQNDLEKLGFKLYLRPANYDYSNGITSSIMIEDNKIIGVSDPRSDDYLAIEFPMINMDILLNSESFLVNSGLVILITLIAVILLEQ